MCIHSEKGARDTIAYYAKHSNDRWAQADADYAEAMLVTWGKMRKEDTRAFKERVAKNAAAAAQKVAEQVSKTDEYTSKVDDLVTA